MVCLQILFLNVQPFLEVLRKELYASYRSNSKARCVMGAYSKKAKTNLGAQPKLGKKELISEVRSNGDTVILNVLLHPKV